MQFKIFVVLVVLMAELTPPPHQYVVPAIADESGGQRKRNGHASAGRSLQGKRRKNGSGLQESV